MGKITQKLAVLATALAVTVTGFSTGYAMPLPGSAPVTAPPPVVNVQFTQERGDNMPRGWERGRPDRRWDRRWDRRIDRRWDRRADGYYNGHRGYRDRRSGYRFHNGFWFPLAAFATGAIISGATQPQRISPGRYTSSHVAWCQQRYKTYRASDNTFVANSRGERRFCNSPY
ncbi:BA14K family protein [Rhizobium sp. SSA_523]|uniref:BA14K family protein n=1 Tax=Rhizobium sp. SSA_523 TaxID=2952477 RepID=UPI0020906F78|nr:BA14K family protein [Rhizobium sp. SSA_523]MCO5731084.1 BA14K family protein [Rhizobium sp. SSA_523]WKC24115.1 BA14K family protein [Rhizobium sp. SSA_523]